MLNCKVTIQRKVHLVSFGFGPDMVHFVVFIDLTSWCFGAAGYVGLVATAGTVSGWSQHIVCYHCLCASHLISCCTSQPFLLQDITRFYMVCCMLQVCGKAWFMLCIALVFLLARLDHGSELVLLQDRVIS